MKMKLLYALLPLLLALGLSSCSNNAAPQNPQKSVANDTALYSMNESQYYSAAATAPARAPEPNMDGGERYYEDESAENSELAIEGSVTVDPDTGQEREAKIIKNADMIMETESFDDTINGIKSYAKDSGGYIQSYDSYVYETYSQNKSLRQGTITVRIPYQKYNDVLTAIQALGNVKRISESEVDATTRYYDINTRIETKKVEEERVLSMIDRAKTVEDLILLEQRLSDIRATIELYQSQLSDIGRQASYSTMIVNVTEVKEPSIQPVSDGFGSQIKNSFIGGINATIGFFEGVLVFLAGAVIPLGVILLLCTVLWLIIKASRRRAGRKYPAAPPVGPQMVPSAQNQRNGSSFPAPLPESTQTTPENEHERMEEK